MMRTQILGWTGILAARPAGTGGDDRHGGDDDPGLRHDGLLQACRQGRPPPTVRAGPGLVVVRNGATA